MPDGTWKPTFLGILFELLVNLSSVMFHIFLEQPGDCSKRVASCREMLRPFKCSDQSFFFFLKMFVSVL